MRLSEGLKPLTSRKMVNAKRFLEILNTNNGNIKDVAKALGIKHQSIHRMMLKYNIRRTKIVYEIKEN